MGITRIGHVEFFTTDLDRAIDFYVNVIGLVETESDDDSNGCGHISFRVSEEADLDQLAGVFRGDNRPVFDFAEGEEPGQGRAIRVADPFGFPIEFYHSMDPAERVTRTHGNTGPSRIDHVNLRIPTPVDQAVAYYRENFGFQISEFAEHPDGTLFAAWMRRKQTTHDVAWVHGPGTFIHHAGFYVPESHDVLAIADRMASCHMQHQIEFGPGRHGITNAFFAYLRDPDWNRIEIYSGDYLIADPDWEPIRWTHADFEATGRLAWGSPAPASMYDGLPVADWTADKVVGAGS
jgi:catechol 2,3-dioxygenase